MKRPNNKKLKVFIVDDDPFCRMMYSQHLQNLGFEDNFLFSNGSDCINSLTEQPDIVFLDYDMKPHNGLEILKIIRQYNPGIYLLMLSAQKDIRVAINALKHGAFDYIPKGDNDLDAISKVVGYIKETKSNDYSTDWSNMAIAV